MAKRPLPKRMFKDQDRVSSYTTGQSSGKLMKQMSRDHLDILQNVEFVLVTRYRKDPDMDDLAASQALRASLKGTVPDDSRVAQLVADLANIREMRSDVSDDLWHNAYRVVDDSVRRHSDLRPGEKSYLRFTAQYVR